MKTASQRVVPGRAVYKNENGVSITLYDGDILELSLDQLRNLVAFAIDGTEPPLSADEIARREKSERLAKTIEELLKDDES